MPARSAPCCVEQPCGIVSINENQPGFGSLYLRPAPLLLVFSAFSLSVVPEGWHVLISSFCLSGDFE